MTTQHWLIYLTLVLAATSTPGPAVLFIITKSTLYGWRKAVFAALGNILGLFCLGIVTVAGLGAILETSEIMFRAIKYAGAAYLIYLGVRMWLQKGPDFGAANGGAVPNGASSSGILFQAFGVAISNPKAIVFLTALFPQFLDTERALWPQFSMLIATLMFFSFSFLMSYALLAHQAKTWFLNPSRARAVGRTSGSIFIGLGLLLVVSSRR